MRLTGVGVGPGDPELVTVKGVRVLREADVVVVPVMDAGETGRAEATVRAHVDGEPLRLVFALDDRGGPTAERLSAWEAAADRVAQSLRDGAQTVAFATIGDPVGRRLPRRQALGGRPAAVVEREHQPERLAVGVRPDRRLRAAHLLRVHDRDHDDVGLAQHAHALDRHQLRVARAHADPYEAHASTNLSATPSSPAQCRCTYDAWTPPCTHPSGSAYAGCSPARGSTTVRWNSCPTTGSSPSHEVLAGSVSR